MWSIRRATLDDVTDIASLYVRTRRLAYAPFYPPGVLAAMSVPAEAEKWHARLSEETAHCLLAVDESGAIAGFTHISWHDPVAPATGEIEFMYVAPEHQGEGLGAMLMAEAEAGLAAKSLQDAILWVYERNTPARRFYEGCGWSDDGGRRESGSAPGQYLARYRKRLA